ncbi:hypothetical protein [Rhodococcus aerolatus]
MVPAPAPWFWLQPAVTGLAALLVLLGAALTVRQRHRADRKDQWWKRTQWAFDLLLAGDQDGVVLGLQVLSQQALATAADREDAQFIADVVAPLVDEYLAQVDTGEDLAEDPDDGARADPAGDEEQP